MMKILPCGCVRRLADIINDEESGSLWSQLPIDILVSIALFLDKNDAVQFCSTCKAWALVAPLVKQPKAKAPLLLLPPDSDGTCELFDVTHRKTHFIHAPEIMKTEMLYSRDGWLLASGNGFTFFLNPFTKEKIQLFPSRVPRYLCAFSSQPVLPDCLVFFIRSLYPNRVRIEMYRVHSKKMTDATFRNEKPFKQASTNPVFCNGYFYCLGKDGKLGVFNPRDLIWTISSPRADTDFKKSEVKYLIQSRGELFVACEAGAKVRVFWLERSKMKWTEMKKLGKRMLFLHSNSSFLAGTDSDEHNVNRIFFPRMRRYTRKCCVSFSLDACRYHPSRELFECRNFDSDMMKPLWIEAEEFDPLAKLVQS
ncbi:F-box/kelch-repeat protein At1g57790-like [Aristolochia californica]|uniref:F-box/kelch-repeat protein At1g57790-like n=1 Tax=Aristolochia californica TaxID=171875 RepID=UPI0035D8FFA5